MRHVLTILILILCTNSKAQETSKEYKPQLHLGFGLGIDYGGLPGASLMYSPIRQVGIYSGVGNAFVGVGYCAGLKVKGAFENNQGLVPFILGMYGTNAVVRINDVRPLSRIFSGFSLGGGFEIHPGTSRESHFSLTVILPYRKHAVKNYLDFLESNYGMIYTSKLKPVLLSIGYQYAF